jgi:predicted nucleic acid-binding protein
VILDTNAVSAWAEHDPSALRLIEARESLCLPVIVLGEFRFGLRGSRKRSVLEPQLNFLEQPIRQFHEAPRCVSPLLPRLAP